MRKWLFLALAVASIVPTARAQTPGTYATSMGYVIEVSFQGDLMSVVEPSNGKRSEYVRQGDGRYHFTNPVNGISYTMEVRDGSTLIANKPGAPASNGTVLSLRSAAGEVAGASETVDESEQERMMEVALGYLGRAQSGDGDAQAWSFCGFAAMARAEGGGPSQVLQAAQALRSIATTSVNPCSDAIPDEVWASAQ